MLSQGFKNLLVSLGHMLTDSQKLCVADKIREFVTSVLDVKMNEWWAAIKVCPTLKLIAKCALSIFHGPQVESSFSFMKDLMSKKKGRMTVSTFSSMQTIKYYLMSKKAVSVHLFQRSSINHTPVDRALVANIISATRCHKEELKEKREALNAQLDSYHLTSIKIQTAAEARRIKEKYLKK